MKFAFPNPKSKSLEISSLYFIQENDVGMNSICKIYYVMNFTHVQSNTFSVTHCNVFSLEMSYLHLLIKMTFEWILPVKYIKL